MTASSGDHRADQAFDRDLRRRRARERKEDLRKERGKTYLFHLGMVDGATHTAVAELNEILEGVGVRFELSDQSFQSYDYNYLEITVREENVRNIQTRHAGRPENPVLYIDPETGVETHATVHKVEGLIAREGAVGAAAVLGMSKAGMYRRLGRSRIAARRCDRSDEPLDAEDIRF